MSEIGEVVLVYMEGNPAFFARIEDITPDVKPQWFRVKMLVLQVPLFLVTWILREPYIKGEEFTMGGRPIRLERVLAPEEPEEEEGPEEEAPPAAPEAAPKPQKIVSLSDRRKKDHSS